MLRKITAPLISIVVVAVMSIAASAPAQGHTRNQAIYYGCGPSFVQVSGLAGQRLKTAGGATYGWVYVAYSVPLDQFCVVTNKIAFHGKRTPTLARLQLLYGNGSTSRVVESWPAATHWASVKIKAARRPATCLAFWGDVRPNYSGKQGAGGRWSFAGCPVNPPPSQPPPPSQTPAPSSKPSFEFWCTPFSVSCTLGFNRSKTKVATSFAGFLSISGAACAVTTGPFALICGVAVAANVGIWVGYANLVNADGDCLGIRKQLGLTLVPQRVRFGEHNCG